MDAITKFVFGEMVKLDRVISLRVIVSNKKDILFIRSLSQQLFDHGCYICLTSLLLATSEEHVGNFESGSALLIELVADVWFEEDAQFILIIDFDFHLTNLYKLI
jgi:hypothetical protein